MKKLTVNLPALASGAVELARRLDRVREIIEAVDNRCMACDGPVTPTLKEMRQSEISEIYSLSQFRTAHV